MRVVRIAGTRELGGGVARQLAPAAGARFSSSCEGMMFFETWNSTYLYCKKETWKT